MARVTGPLMSMSASGTVGKALTYGAWKGREWCREWFIPQNPKSFKQVNIRKALTLLIASWQTQTTEAKAKWDTYAEAFRMAGVNKFVGKGLKAYIEQLDTDTTPASVSLTGDPPAEVWTWTPVGP